jgi:hypothetical protein
MVWCGRSGRETAQTAGWEMRERHVMLIEVRDTGRGGRHTDDGMIGEMRESQGEKGEDGMGETLMGRGREEAKEAREAGDRRDRRDSS